MRERPGRPRFLGIVTRLGDQAVEARDGVLDHWRQIVREASPEPIATSGSFGPPTGRQRGRAWRRSLKVAQDALDLALLGKGHRHIEVQPDHMAIEVSGWSAMCAAH